MTEIKTMEIDQRIKKIADEKKFSRVICNWKNQRQRGPQQLKKIRNCITWHWRYLIINFL